MELLVVLKMECALFLEFVMSQSSYDDSYDDLFNAITKEKKFKGEISLKGAEKKRKKGRIWMKDGI